MPFITQPNQTSVLLNSIMISVLIGQKVPFFALPQPAKKINTVIWLLLPLKRFSKLNRMRKSLSFYLLLLLIIKCTN
jgi:hypothetical protein